MIYRIFFFSLLAGSFSLYAQEEGLYLGLTAGTGSFWLYDKTVWGLDPEVLYAERATLFEGNSWMTGISGEYRISSRLGIGSGVFFSDQTQRYEQIFGPYYPTSFYKVSQQLQYLSLPVSIWVHGADSYRPVGFYAAVGLQGMLLTGYRIITQSRRYAGNSSYPDGHNYLYRAIHNNTIYVKEDYEPSVYTSVDSSAERTIAIDWLHRRYGLSGQVEVGIELLLADSWHIRLGVRGNTVLTNAYNPRAMIYYNGNMYPGHGALPGHSAGFTRAHPIQLHYLLSVSRKISGW